MVVLFRADMVAVYGAFWLGRGLFSEKVWIQISWDWEEVWGCNLALMRSIQYMGL